MSRPRKRTSPLRTLAAVAAASTAALALAAPAAAQHVTSQELLSRPPVVPDLVVSYGADSLQFGHLRIPPSSALHSQDPLPVAGVVNLDGPADLEAFRAEDERVCGGPVIDRLMGGPPAEVPKRYAAADPARILPLGVPQRLLRGEHDGAVPAELQAAYVEGARATGDDVEGTTIPDAAHFEAVAPWAERWSEIWPLIRGAVDEMASGATLGSGSSTTPLVWGDCPFDRSEIEESEGLRVRCGELSVPEDWKPEEDRTLGIAFTVAEPEGGSTGEPVVLIPGGPGMTVVPRGLRLLRRWGVEDRTLVVFDVRGTGHSGPLMCTGLSITESDVASMDLTLEEARTLERGAYLACRDELLNRGVDLRAYRSATAARDVRALREALGYERWNLLGGSYGVTLGRSVLRADSDGVRSATFLAGPHPDPEMLVTKDVPNFARALELYFDLCASDPACASRHPRLEEDLYATHEALQAEPWTVPVDPERFRRSTFTVNAQDFIRLVYATLGSDTELPELAGLIRAFRDRDEAAAAAVLEDEHGGLSSTFSTGLMYAVDCNDAYTLRSRAEREAAAEGHPAALDDIRYFLAPCPDWPDPDPAPGERAPVESDVPALVVTAEMDPMNPPATGEEHLRYLENGHHFVVPDASHGMAFNPRTAPCVAELVAGFLDDPERRPDGSCLDELEPRRLISAGTAAERPGSARARGKTSTSSAPGSTIQYSGTPWHR